jgi:transcriptional regulator with XRE-family HTH domain
MGFASHNAYSHWELGKASPNIRDLDKLAEVFGVTISELLFGEAGEQTPVPSGKVAELETEIKHLKRENMLLQMLAKEKGVEFPKFKGATIMPDFNLFRKNNPRFILWNQGISKRKGL